MTPTPVPVWSTPTPYPNSALPSGLTIEPLGNNMFATVAESAVQTYSIANRDGIIDGVLFVVILFAVLFGARRLLRQIRDV